MAIVSLAEDLAPKVAQGLSASNIVIGILGGTVISTATTVATAQPLLIAAAAASTIHEDQKRVVERYAYETLPRLNADGIFTDTNIAAANDTATWRAAFTAKDTSLPADYVAGLEDD